jgi:hypothetical protein
MTERSSDRTLVVLDDRMRAPLGRIADRKEYLVHREPSGRIVLEPAVTLTEAELRLHDDAAFWARVATAIDEPVTPFELPD